MAVGYARQLGGEFPSQVADLTQNIVEDVLANRLPLVAVVVGWPEDRLESLRPVGDRPEDILQEPGSLRGR